MNKRISVFLCIVICFNFIMSSLSFGASNSSITAGGELIIQGEDIFEQDMGISTSGVFDGTNDYYYATPINVTQEGIYQSSVTTTRNGESIPYVIVKKDGDTLTPVSIAVYGDTDSGTLDIRDTNGNGRASFYLNTTDEYYVVYLDRESLGSRDDRAQTAVSISEVQNPGGQEPIQIADMSTMDYTSLGHEYSADSTVTKITGEGEGLLDIIATKSNPDGIATSMYEDEIQDDDEQEDDEQGDDEEQGESGEGQEGGEGEQGEGEEGGEQQGGGQTPIHGSGYITSTQIQIIAPDYESSYSDTEKEHKVDALERVITWLVVHGIGDALRALVGAVVGSDVTIDKLLFNDFPDTRLSFFKGDNQNNFLNTKVDDTNGITVIDIIQEYYNAFRNIALTFYVIILLYIGIRALLKSTGRDREKSKSMVLDWLKGLLLLFIMPYFIYGAIKINDGLVDAIKEMKQGIVADDLLPSIDQVGDQNIAQALHLEGADYMDGDLMMKMRSDALRTGSIVYGVIYVFLIKELVGFLVMYYKRLITILFLIVLYPFVVITYAIDKVGDGRAQVFGNWLNEFLLNVFMQLFQAIIYLIIMTIISALGNLGSGGASNILLILIAITFISKGESLLKALFPRVMRGGPANTVGTLSSSVKTVLDVKMFKTAVSSVTNIGKRITNVGATARKFNEDRHASIQDAMKEHKEDLRLHEYQEQVRESSGVSGHISTALTGINSGTLGPDGLKALKQLVFAKNSPELRAEFEKEVAKLSNDERRKLLKNIEFIETTEELITHKKRNNVIDETLELDTKVAVFLALKADSEVASSAIENDLKTKDYVYNVRGSDGKIKEKRVNSHDRLMTEVYHSGRTLSIDGKQGLDSIDGFLGHQMGIHTDRKVNVSWDDTAGQHVVVGGTDSLRVKSLTEVGTTTTAFDEATKASMISGGTTRIEQIAGGSLASLSDEEKKTAETIFMLEQYKTQIDSGTIEGVDATEALKIFSDLRVMHETGSDSVKDMIDRSINFGASDGSSKIQLNTSLEAATVASAAAVQNTREALTEDDFSTKIKVVEGSQVREYDLTEAAGHILTNGSTDEVAKAVVSRSDLDIGRHNGSLRKGEYVRDDSMTSRQYFEEVEVARQTEQVINTENRMSRSEHRARLFRDGLNMAGSTVSATAGSVANIGTGVFSTALFSGMADKTTPRGLITVYNVGTGAENVVESLVPGTIASGGKDNSKGVGGKMGKASEPVTELIVRTATGEKRYKGAVAEKRIKDLRAQGRINEIRDKL